MRGTGAPLAAVLLCLGLVLAPSTEAAAVDPSCRSDAPDSPLIAELPWAQQRYDPANKLWPFSVGAGSTVAVLGSGVDATHPQLQGRVLPGISLVPETPPTGNIDCVPFGTAVASIIAARPVDGVGFTGLAPEATILPVRVSDTIHTKPDDDLLPPTVLAAGIDFAVDSGANVIAVPAVSYAADPALQASVQRAIEAGVPVVAAAGDGHNEGRHGFRPTPDVPFPAAYDGVIGVGAVGMDGIRAQTSQIGSYVDLVAPGLDVTAAAFFGHSSFNGTGIAVGFVAAAVALMLSQPGSDLRDLAGAELVAALTAQLFGAADGAAGGTPTLAYGNGLVDPYRAMVEATGGTVPQAVPGRQAPPQDIAAERLAAQRAAASNAALVSAAVLGGLAVLVLAAAFLLPRARRRRWRAGRDRELRPEREDKRPEFLPGEMLFRTSPGKDTDTLARDRR